MAQIRQSWPDVEITIRADSAFSRDDIMTWCEEHDVDYVLGLARNKRLERMIEDEMKQARTESERTGAPSRIYKDMEYSTLDSWSRVRRVVAKAEYLTDKTNARFVVTSLSIETFSARTLYEDEYCARGEMENRIKEQKSFLFSDRTSAATISTPRLLRAKPRLVWPLSISPASTAADSRWAEARVPDAASSRGGCQNATVR